MAEKNKALLYDAKGLGRGGGESVQGREQVISYIRQSQVSSREGYCNVKMSIYVRFVQ